MVVPEHLHAANSAPQSEACMREIFDEYVWTKHKKLLTRQEHGLPGLNNIAHRNDNIAVVPSQMHYHADIIEVHCMVKGRRATHIEKDGRIEQHACTGSQAFLTFPFELHSNGEQPVEPSEFYAFQVNISEPSRMLGLNRENSRELHRQLTGLKNRHLRLERAHLGYVRDAFEQISGLTPQSILIGSQFLTCFLLCLPLLTPVSGLEVRNIDASIKKAIDYLNENIRESLQLIDLADVAGYSLSRFKVLFREEIGITPAEYITMQKVDLAKKLLAGTDMSITDLAYSLSFSSSNYFSAVFKKTFNCTPNSFRQRHRHGQ
jgi:AraC-like DNA-binding protein